MSLGVLGVGGSWCFCGGFGTVLLEFLLFGECCDGIS